MIKTLIIMTTYGQIFYSKQGFFGADVGESDISLTAGLISAIYSMTSETQEQKITELELEEDRSVFREMPGEKLFIITVDKRMDTSDADDLLTEMVDRFDQKYGDIVMDGMILSDFEPIVDEIVEKKLWYNTTEKRASLKDYAVLFTLLLGAIFYPYWLLNGQENLVDPIKKALEDNIFQMILKSFILGLYTIAPISIIIYITRKYSHLNEPFRFSKEFLKRPTRGGYSELLPSWFLVFPVFSIVLFGAAIRFGRGIQYALSIQALPEKVDSKIVLSDGTQVFWTLVFIYISLYLLTWFLFLPAIIGSFTQQLNWNFLKSTWLIIGISLITLIPAQILAGVHYQESIGYHPQNEELATEEGKEIAFLFKVTLLINLSLFVFIFLVGIGISQLIKKNKGRYPVAFGFGLFMTIAIQNVLFYIIFNSGLIFEGKTFG
ncbi:MAG: hypothetical protein HeimC2_26190 [Candidatus Heimdallarchaeota archaeon LC_2]|nr:MAG: hypothetical protein HeimC2_26190 [Candidatus Heimdallarchaeota archaeon LC_2]